MAQGTGDVGDSSEGVAVFKSQDWLDRVFAVGIIGKGLNGAAELIGGVLLLLLTWREYGQQRLRRDALEGQVVTSPTQSTSNPRRV